MTGPERVVIRLWNFVKRLIGISFFTNYKVSKVEKQFKILYYFGVNLLQFCFRLAV